MSLIIIIIFVKKYYILKNHLGRYNKIESTFFCKLINCIKIIFLQEQDKVFLKPYLLHSN